jgi:hypothetical protein
LAYYLIKIIADLEEYMNAPPLRKPSESKPVGSKGKSATAKKRASNPTPFRKCEPAPPLWLAPEGEGADERIWVWKTLRGYF